MRYGGRVRSRGSHGPSRCRIGGVTGAEMLPERDERGWEVGVG